MIRRFILAAALLLTSLQATAQEPVYVEFELRPLQWYLLSTGDSQLTTPYELFFEDSNVPESDFKSWAIFRIGDSLGTYQRVGLYQTLVPGIGFWVIHVTEYTVRSRHLATGVEDDASIPVLSSGWNLIGSPNAFPMRLTNRNLDIIWRWDSDAGEYRALSYSRSMQPGLGYWARGRRIWEAEVYKLYDEVPVGPVR